MEVSDTGPGMTAAQLDEAMHPFVQLSTTSARRHRGIGLGLAIVSQNVASLKGRLDLRATPGGGATFTVRFPERALAAQPRPRRAIGVPRVPSVPH
ncbi:MAG TPA: ATP-binding protein [Candidatus Binataceae bacterium]|nr:ATP-binding protein [Candidatus Binataceae bacterium]